MQKDEWLKINELFHQVVDLSANEREELLVGQNDFVRSEVSELIASHENVDNFIAESAVVELGLHGKSLVGSQIGNYKLLEIIGAGGMGTVFRAEKNGFGKNFAVKLIKRGMDTDAILRRFQLEWQILSQLEHPNISRLLDVGTTDDGLPYFVMEYVEGLPILKFCDVNRLDIRERLKFFRSICSAVSYAHQNLIVHRDLKPSNILMTNDGTPKLLDFGIAKFINIEGFENTATATQGRIFTPEYASPEQLSGLRITTASDVFSLGVVLYELLSGQRPFQSKSRNYQEITNAVLTEEPIRPSSVVSRKWSAMEKTSENKGETENEIPTPKSGIQNPKSLEGDLDNIILKSLRKESDRRYQSVQEFSDDIRYYLAGLPVSATADSTFYRFSKFVVRHKNAAFLSSLIALVIFSISGIAVWQGFLAMRERERAEKRFEQVRKLAHIVLFEYHDGIAQLPGATAMREKMVKDSLEFLDNLLAESIDNIELQRETVAAYRKVGDIQGASDTGNIGETENSLASYQKAFVLQEKIVEWNSESIEDQITLGNLNLDIGLQQRSTGDLQTAEKSFQNALKIFSNLPIDLKTQSALANTLWNIASLQTAQNNLDSSLEYYQKALEIYQQLAIDEPSNKRHLRNIALTNKNIGSVLQLRGENEKALQHFQKSLAIDLENEKNNPHDVSAGLDLSFTYGTIGSALRDAKNFQGSVENYQKAIDIREKIFNADNKNAFAENALARGYQELGETFLAQQKFVGAEEMFYQSQTIYQKMSDADAENYDKKAWVAENLALLGYVNGSNQNLNKATDYYAKSLEIYADLSKQGKLSTLNQRRFASVYLDYGEILLKNKQSAKALEKLQKAQELMENDKVKRDANEELAKLNRLLSEVAGE